MSASNKKGNLSTKSGKGSSKSGKSNLPLILVGGGVVLVILAAIFIYGSNQPSKPDASIEVSGAPALNVDKDSVDFGDVKVDTPVSATFEITNVGDQPLRFSQTPTVEVVEGC